MLDAGAVGTSVGWLEFLSVTGLGIAAYFLKRSLDTQDDLQKEVNELKTEIKTLKAVLLDRDRRRRISDYQQEDAES